ncbi:SDH family Clp fold serine proteinase [Amycolatopsis lurida]
MHILVPEHARSAGTMLCLAAEKLTMGAGASLGPIDPQITASGQGRRHRTGRHFLRGHPETAGDVRRLVRPAGFVPRAPGASPSPTGCSAGTTAIAT